MTRSLRHFGIVVRDLDRMLDFYCGLLGLSVVRRMEESGEFIDALLGCQGVEATTVKLAAAEGETLLELLRFTNPKTTARGVKSLFSPGPTHFALTMDGVQAFYARASQAGTRFITAPRVSADGKAMVAFCFDPEDNPIELVQILD